MYDAVPAYEDVNAYDDDVERKLTDEYDDDKDCDAYVVYEDVAAVMAWPEKLAQLDDTAFAILPSR